MEKYVTISQIGEGSFAKVFRGREKFTGRVCIVIVEIKHRTIKIKHYSYF